MLFVHALLSITRIFYITIKFDRNYSNFQAHPLVLLPVAKVLVVQISSRINYNLIKHLLNNKFRMRIYRDIKNFVVSVLECEANVLRSIHSSGELIGLQYVDWQNALTWKALWNGQISYSWVWGFDLCGQHDLRIKALNKLKVLSIGHQWDPSVMNRVISVTLQGSLFPVCSHKSVWIWIAGHSF